MDEPGVRVGVVVERRPSASPWEDHVFAVRAVVPEAPGTADGHLLGTDGDAALIYAGAAEVAFHRVETGGYRDNLRSGRSSLWVVLERQAAAPGVRLLSVTADPAEGEAMTENGGLLVEVVPMPPDLAERLAAFVAAHHVERPFVKRKRE